MSIVQELARLCLPWQSVYSNSTTVSTSVVAVHVLSLLGGGGLAIAADRMTMRSAKASADMRAAHLGELRALHPLVIGALSLIAVSGLLLAAADVEEFAGSPVFWTKMTLVGVLLMNGVLMHRRETALRRLRDTGVDGSDNERALWRRLVLCARLSAVLWFTIPLLGLTL